MTRYSFKQLVLISMFLCISTQAFAQPAEVSDFSGAWDTTYGLLELTQEGAEVRGRYTYGGGSTVLGTVEGNRLTFRYAEPTVEGDGWFELSPTGDTLNGQWKEDGSTDWFPWEGVRTAARPGHVADTGWNGLFETTYGRMRLNATAEGVSGSYSYGGGSTVTGTVAGTRLTFRYQEPGVSGEGWFELSEDGNSFAGQWKADGSSDWSEWSGTRIVAEEGVSWLVVFEAAWETSLAENEYAFGDMLRAYFERMPHVNVRHRRINDRVDFLRAANDLAYLAEPVALLIASHGSGGVLTLNGETISATDVGSSIADAPNVFSVHFSSCEVMIGEAGQELRRALPDDRYLAISGYAISVDWSASALIEFLYLDLILGRGMSPARAAEVVLRDLPFAGDGGQGPLGPARFRFED